MARSQYVYWGTFPTFPPHLLIWTNAKYYAKYLHRPTHSTRLPSNLLPYRNYEIAFAFSEKINHLSKTTFVLKLKVLLPSSRCSLRQRYTVNSLTFILPSSFSRVWRVVFIKMSSFHTYCVVSGFCFFSTVFTDAFSSPKTIKE